MSAAEFFAASRVLIVAGKGGVGKTTLGATLGLAAASVGLNTQLVELEGHSRLGSPFGLDGLPYKEIEIIFDSSTVRGAESSAGKLSGRRITPDEALVEYLQAHGLNRLSGRLIKTGAIDVVSTAAPGIQDLLALGKIRSIEQEQSCDLLIVDAPAAGHALSFLRSPAGLSDSVADGPLHEQAELVLEMLGDASRCQVMLVTLPEETPVTEAIETAYSLEDDIGIKLAPIVVNGLLPEIPGLKAALESGESRANSNRQAGSSQSNTRSRGGALLAAGRYRQSRMDRQSAECDRLDDELPLDQIRLPQLATAELGMTELSQLASLVIDQVSGFSS